MLDRHIFECEGCESMCSAEISGDILAPTVCYFNAEEMEWKHTGKVKTLEDKVQTSIVHSELCGCELCVNL